MRKTLPNKFRWECILVTREKKKGRAKSGIIMAINTRLECRKSGVSM